MRPIQTICLSEKPDPESLDTSPVGFTATWGEVGGTQYLWLVTRGDSTTRLDEAGRMALLEHFQIKRAAHLLPLDVMREVGPRELMKCRQKMEIFMSTQEETILREILGLAS